MDSFDWRDRDVDLLRVVNELCDTSRKPRNMLRGRMRTVPAYVSVFAAVAVALVPNSFGQYSGIAKYRKHEQNIDQRLARLDTLDLYVVSHQDWRRLNHSHAKNIVVHWPDGRRTKGLDQHIQDLKAMFVYAPDTRVRSHPVKFGSRDWTCFIGEMEGTFTRPMPTPEGREIPPTGKRFKIRVCTVGHWNKDGLMDEEYFFWDNQSYMRQLGLTK